MLLIQYVPAYFCLMYCASMTLIRKKRFMEELSS